VTSPYLSAPPRSEGVARASGLGLSVAIEGSRVLILCEGSGGGYMRSGRPAFMMRPEDAREIAADLVRAADVIDGRLVNTGGMKP
jgi:hypothetical protein